MKKWKIEKTTKTTATNLYKTNKKKLKTENKNTPKKTLPNSDPPNHFHRVRIILGKLVTKATHHTNQEPTLSMNT